MMLVDSHCHLNYPQFSDLAAVIARAEAKNVGIFQTISTKRSDFAEIKAICDDFPQIYGSIGIHPHESEPHEDISEQELIEEAAHPKIIGIGETGLDFYYEHSPRNVQERLFHIHIRAARTLDLPVIIHSRDADIDTVRVLTEAKKQGDFRFLLHCFSSTQYLADAALEMGGYLSFSGIITFKKAQELRDIASTIPAERLLVETDAPYLAPEPFRGRDCEPAFTAITAQKLAEIRGVSLEEIAACTTQNFSRLFCKALF
jgi:TatD DNase family protein